MRKVKLAVVQMACGEDTAKNLDKAERMIRAACAGGAQIVLTQELFETPYFCQTEKPEFYEYAKTVQESKAVSRFRKLAAELGAVLPVSFYERQNNARYNSAAVIDAGGEILGVYRKSHIPDGPGYEEKFYFNPGDTGFKVFNTAFGRIGVGICWDQWFPEAARCMALMGAELILYPTAIGSEPEDAGVDSRDHWRRCMAGHAAANLVPVAAANRVGRETAGDSSILFYGSSFITGATGEILAEAGRTEEAILTAELDLDEIARQRADWGIFRDRRPELYAPLLTNDGETRITGI